MYDLNLSIPNITSPKYTDDNRFLLLKNYLYELNEVLSFALSDKTENEVNSLYNSFKKSKENTQTQMRQLQEQSVNRFNSLKEQIIRTADEIEKDYNSKITQTERSIMQSVSSDYVLKSDFGEYENSVDTRFSQTAEQISLVSQNTDAVSNDLEIFKDTTRSELILQSEAITSQVENIYTTKNETQELESRIDSQITQTAQTITENFSKDIKTVNDDISSVGGKVSELVSSLDVYIRRGELEEGVYGIEIGRSDSNIKARFTNDRLSFFQGVAEVAYISGSSLYITNADILDYLRIGNQSNGYFLFDTTENGLEVRWINGD